MFGAIYIPDFALQAVLRHESELFSSPVALIAERSPKAKIFQLTAAARSAGVIEGMTPPQAMARCERILIRTRSTNCERTAGAALIECGLKFSPLVESTGDGVCTLDLKGLRIVDCGLRKVAEDIIAHLARLHLSAQVGIAQNPDLSLLAAQHAEPFLLVENATQFLAPLPVKNLFSTIRDPQSAILHKWGIHTLGAFTALGKSPLIERLGPEAITLFDRAAGNFTRPLRAVAVPEIFEESMEFENELETLEPLLFILRRLLEQISTRLEMAYKVAAEITLRLNFSAGTPYERTLKIPTPTTRIETLFRMLHTHLENFRSESPIVALHLSATPCSASHQQFGLFETALRDPNQFSETLARLAAIVGANCVGTPQALDTHRPDAFDLVSFDATDNPQVKTKKSCGLVLRRFRPPLPANVQLENSVPVFIDSSKLTAAVNETRGPWRSSGDWWDRSGWRRHEWDIETAAGELCRIYCEQGEWFVDGIYD